jgi:hypothetical protein
MNKQDDSRNFSDDFELPGALLDDLIGLYGRPVGIPAEIDARMKKATWRHFAQKPWWRIPSIRWLAPLAAAAVVVVMLLSVSRESTRPAMKPAYPRMRQTLRDVSRDFDGDGRFDIIDVLALAQTLEQGLAVDMAWDANGDGTIDGEDVDLLAQSAVIVYEDDYAVRTR